MIIEQQVVCGVILCIHTLHKDRAVSAAEEMMGLIGMGNNPMVGAMVAVAVAVEEAMRPAAN